jgi:hypothetical protein
MNIFLLDMDWQTNATYHVDKHVVKMILESAQLLSTAVRLSGIDAGYKAAYKNHPCAIWTRQSLANWKWLYYLTEALNEEYKYRYNKKVNHKSYDVVQSLPLPNIEDIGVTQFAQAMPNCYKSYDPVQAYRNYYIGEKDHLFSWTKRDVPYWINENNSKSI